MGAVLAGLCLILLPMAPASAHADFVSMNPEPGSTVTESPSEVVVTFNEAVVAMGTAIVVIDPDGNEVQQGETMVDGANVSVQLGPITVGGTYHVNYRVTADDGHVEADSKTFEFAPAEPMLIAASPTDYGTATPAPEVSPIKEASSTAGYWITGLLMLCLLLVGAGIARARGIGRRGNG